jgi:hypothetical protein
LYIFKFIFKNKEDPIKNKMCDFLKSKIKSNTISTCNIDTTETNIIILNISHSIETYQLFDNIVYILLTTPEDNIISTVPAIKGAAAPPLPAAAPRPAGAAAASSIVQTTLDSLKSKIDIDDILTRNIKIYGLVYPSKRDPTLVASYLNMGDALYIQRDDLMIIYNENFIQFSEKNNFAEGAGNGIMRKYRSDEIAVNSNRVHGGVKAEVYGIPTGEYLTDDIDKTKKDNCNLVIEAIKGIIKKIKDTPKIKYILYSASSETNKRVGNGIFNHTDTITTCNFIYNEFLKRIDNNVTLITEETGTSKVIQIPPPVADPLVPAVPAAVPAPKPLVPRPPDAAVPAPPDAADAAARPAVVSAVAPVLEAEAADPPAVPAEEPVKSVQQYQHNNKIFNVILRNKFLQNKCNDHRVNIKEILKFGSNIVSRISCNDSSTLTIEYKTAIDTSEKEDYKKHINDILNKKLSEIQYDLLTGGHDKYHAKYMKYKAKYLQLKNSM